MVKPRAAACVLVLTFTAAAQTVTINAAAPRTPVSPNLYGIFFEEINHSGEGGLYAEMVMNRDFETVNQPAGASWAGNLLRTGDGWQERKWFGNELQGWKLTAAGGGRGSIHLDTAEPLNNQNPHSMRLNIRQEGKRIGVVNSGFWGMNFRARDWYDLQFYLRSAPGEYFDITVSLVSASLQETYATTVIHNAGGEWRRYKAALQARSSDSDGRLLITVNRPGTLWLDVVSMFPRDTFKGHGLRSDLAGTLAELKPAFLRFPGGAIVGGLNLDNRIQWKNSIGDIAQRKGTPNLWGYYTTNGLGFHEYLQLAEDIGADALWVCNPGFSDNYRHAEYAAPERVAEFVREALDGLEYALGPVTSRWGGERAANGHPAAFRLKYIEIGNEASSEHYVKNYKMFYEAIHARYPEVTIISNQRKMDGAPVFIVDDHRYGSPASLFAANHAYDNADRAGPRIYVGEYGCNRDVGEGNLKAALAEAAFLLGLERNSDIVTMSSYAPLFFNVNDIAWPVNMIGFDASRVAPRSSFYVQKLFAENRPDEVLRTESDGSDLYALAGFDKRRGELIVKLVNALPSERAIHLDIKGLSLLPGINAVVTTLNHSDAVAENTIDEPDLILPRVSSVALGRLISLRPYSLTLVRVPVRP